MITAGLVIAIGLACAAFLRSPTRITRHRFRSHTVCSIVGEVGTRFDHQRLARIANADELVVEVTPGVRAGDAVATVFRHTSFFGGYGCRLEYEGGLLRRKSVYWVDG